MAIIFEKFNINSCGFGDTVDILPKIYGVIKAKDTKNGLLNINVSSPLSVIYVGKSEDFFKLNSFLDETIKSSDKSYNTDTYLATLSFKANYFKNNVTIPVENSKLLLENLDRIYFIDFENKKSIKEILVSILE